jgi:hypothetical protein
VLASQLLWSKWDVGCAELWSFKFCSLYKSLQGQTLKELEQLWCSCHTVTVSTTTYILGTQTKWHTGMRDWAYVSYEHRTVFAVAVLFLVLGFLKYHVDHGGTGSYRVDLQQYASWVVENCLSTHLCAREIWFLGPHLCGFDLLTSVGQRGLWRPSSLAILHVACMSPQICEYPYNQTGQVHESVCIHFGSIEFWTPASRNWKTFK